MRQRVARYRPVTAVTLTRPAWRAGSSPGAAPGSRPRRRSTFAGAATPAGSWADPNGDLGNSRDAAGSRISAANVASLKEAWTFKLSGTAATGVSYAGSLAAAPVVVDGVVYLQDLYANVYAISLATGKLKWEYPVNVAEKSGPGPDGVAVAGGVVYGDTSTAVFALNAATGKVIWNDGSLLGSGQGSFEIQPAVAGGRVYLASAYGSGPGGGVILALDAATGKELWSFNTVAGAAPGARGARPRLRRGVGDAAGRDGRVGDLRDREPVPVDRRGDQPPGAAALHRQRGQPLRRDRQAALVLPGRAERLQGLRPADSRRSRRPCGGVPAVIGGGKMGVRLRV